MLAAIASACSKTEPEPQRRPRDAAAIAIARDAPAVPDVDAAPKTRDAQLRKKTFVNGAGRCGECHGKMFDEWEVSAHARATSSELFKAAMADAQATTKAEECERCHAPLVAQIGREPAASEGVTCDVCHTLQDVKPTADGGSFRLAIDDMVKFGPRCDLKDHYFHRMGCSPAHDQAVICSACHWWERNGVPVFTEYPDWQAGPAAQTPCQSCHMPKEKAPLAVGSPARDGVPHHGLLGLATDLRKRALGMTVAVADDKGALVVSVDLKNVNAGHPVPSGLPERRIMVTVQVGDEIERQMYGRVLGDRTGLEVPFWKATKVTADTRIAPGATAHGDYGFAIAAAGTAKVIVWYLPMAPAIALQLGIPVVQEALFSATIAFDAKHTGKPVTVKPPAPGKRPRL